MVGERQYVYSHLKSALSGGSSETPACHVYRMRFDRVELVNVHRTVVNFLYFMSESCCASGP